MCKRCSSAGAALWWCSSTPRGPSSSRKGRSGLIFVTAFDWVYCFQPLAIKARGGPCIAAAVYLPVPAGSSITASVHHDGATCLTGFEHMKHPGHVLCKRAEAAYVLPSYCDMPLPGCRVY